MSTPMRRIRSPCCARAASGHAAAAPPRNVMNARRFIPAIIRSPHRTRHSPNGRYGILDRVTASVCLDVEGPDDVAPLLGFIGDELAEIGGRERKHVAT